MAASVPSSGSLLTHLVSRIESDLTFLASHNLVTAPELEQIRSTLAEAQVRANGAALELLALRNDPVAHNAGGSMVPVPVQQQQQQPKPQCKAVWDYTKSQPDDLGFKAGDVITIEAEENPDWWRGSLNGQTGLFPSNHVERLPASSNSVPPPPPRIKQESPAAPYAPPPPPGTLYSSPTTSTFQNSWSPSPAPYAYQQPQNYGGGGGVNEKQTLPPPPPAPQQQWNGIPSYAQVPPPPPPPQQQVVVSQDAPGGVKKNKFGGLGKTVGTAFAGGLGFGAGSAIANDAINAIF